MSDLLRALLVLVPLFLLFIGLNIKIIKQDHQAVVERIGGFYKVIGPGVYATIPFIERIAFTSSMIPQNRIVMIEVTADAQPIRITLTWQVIVMDIRQFYYEAEGSMAELETDMTKMVRDRLHDALPDPLEDTLQVLAEKMLESMSEHFQEDGLTCMSITLEESND